MEKEIWEIRSLLRHRERPSADLSFELIEVKKANDPVTLVCRVLGVGTSSFYDWQARRATPSARSVADVALTEKIRAIHTMSRSSYGSPQGVGRIALGEGVRFSRKRAGASCAWPASPACTVASSGAAPVAIPLPRPSDDLVNRQITVDGPDRL
jgi:putative transposase